MAAALGTEPVLIVARDETGDGIAADAGVDRGHPQRPSAICHHLVFAGRRLGGDDRAAALAYLPPNRLRAMPMRYVSTRGAAPALSFEEAMLTGLARDGGLYVPEARAAAGRRPISPRWPG